MEILRSRVNSGALAPFEAAILKRIDWATPDKASRFMKMIALSRLSLTGATPSVSVDGFKSESRPT